MLKNWNRASHLKGVFAAVTILLVVALTACAPQAVDQGAELAAATDRWETALNSGDVEGLVSVYAGDCLLMAPNTEMQKGQDAVRAVFGRMIEAGLGGMLDSVSVAASGDIGHHVGTYELVAPDGSVVDRGKFTETWKKVNGQWQMATDIWNSDLPEGAGKTFLHISHEVKDADVWLNAWVGSGDSKEIFAQNGAPNVRVFQSPENANHVGLVAEISDMDAFMAWVTSPASESAKARDGVIDSTLRFMTEVK